MARMARRFSVRLQNTPRPLRTGGIVAVVMATFYSPSGWTKSAGAIRCGAVSQPAPTPPIRIMGAPRERFRDLYHRFLRISWWRALAGIVVGFLTLNMGFAMLYDVVGGISGANPGSFADAFFFSVQTMATIGYGGMHPVTMTSNLIVVSEAVVGLLVTALATGLVFSKFSVSNARIVFTREVTISPMNGVPTLQFRIGNERANQIVEATLRVTMMRTEHTLEGVVFYRMHELRLVRERTQAFTRSWTALHEIDPSSPLHGATPASLAKDEVELIASVVGIDDTSLQPVHARHTYADTQILFGVRHADILREEDGGTLTLDLTRFHDTVPTLATPTFPYPNT